MQPRTTQKFFAMLILAVSAGFSPICSAISITFSGDFGSSIVTMHLDAYSGTDSSGSTTNYAHWGDLGDLYVPGTLDNFTPSTPLDFVIAGITRSSTGFSLGPSNTDRFTFMFPAGFTTTPGDSLTVAAQTVTFDVSAVGTYDTVFNPGVYTDPNGNFGHNFGPLQIIVTAAVPEPSVIGLNLVALGLVGFAYRRRRTAR